MQNRCRHFLSKKVFDRLPLSLTELSRTRFRAAVGIGAIGLRASPNFQIFRKRSPVLTENVFGIFFCEKLFIFCSNNDSSDHEQDNPHENTLKANLLFFRFFSWQQTDQAYTGIRITDAKMILVFQCFQDRLMDVLKNNIQFLAQANLQIIR